jgi:hypothetical protein
VAKNLVRVVWDEWTRMGTVLTILEEEVLEWVRGLDQWLGFGGEVEGKGLILGDLELGGGWEARFRLSYMLKNI